MQGREAGITKEAHRLLIDAMCLLIIEKDKDFAKKGALFEEFF